MRSFYLGWFLGPVVYITVVVSFPVESTAKFAVSVACPGVPWCMLEVIRAPMRYGLSV